MGACERESARSECILHSTMVQQNHDGLPQKAGFPQSAMNEIHGAIFDPSNPIVPMDGKVRDDLHTDLLRCQRDADLVLALGSSLCGMAADDLVSVVADRARRGKAKGVVIVNLQQTVRDEEAALRIFAPLDTVAAALAEELQLKLPELGGHSKYQLEEDTYSVLYGPDGRVLETGDDRRTLDLSQGAVVRIVAGPDMNMLAGWMEGARRATIVYDWNLRMASELSCLARGGLSQLS